MFSRFSHFIEIQSVYETNNKVTKWSKLKDTIRFQSDPADQTINLNPKTFCKDNFKLLNKNLNFVPTQKAINKDTISKQFEE